MKRQKKKDTPTDVTRYYGRTYVPDIVWYLLAPLPLSGMWKLKARELLKAKC